MKGHWSHVNLVKHSKIYKRREALIKDLHATSVLPFPNANEKFHYGQEKIEVGQVIQKMYFLVSIVAINTVKIGQNVV